MGNPAEELRGQCPWLTAERANTLAGGCVGLLAIFAFVGVQAVEVADTDILDGLVIDMMMATGQGAIGQGAAS